MSRLGQAHIGRPRLPRGKNQLPPEVARRDQRERLIAAALATVSELGYAATTSSEIARRARGSPNVFYMEFRDKQDCVLSAVSDSVALAGQRVAAAVAAVPEDAPAQERLRAAMRANLEFFASEPELSRALHIELRAAGPAGLALYLAVLRAFAEWTRRWHEDADPQAAARTPDTAYAAAMGAIEQLVTERLHTDGAATLPELTEAALRVTLGVLATLGDER
jgi:AcrR family transcriptional regulator